MTTALCRRISGSLFLIANIALLVSNLHNTNNLQLFASFLFMSCSVALFLSANNHRWLFWGGVTVAIAYILTAISNGEGNILSWVSIGLGVFAGGLIFRGGLQRETGKQYPMAGWLSILDKYPLAMAGAIEGLCCTLIFVGAFYYDDIRLMISSFLWLVAHGFLIASDEFFRARLGKNSS